jgi:putative ABC transport system permease protein
VTDDRIPAPRATPLWFAVAMAWRESRASLKRLLLLMAAIAVGVAALVAINSFTENLQDSVRRQAQSILGADIAVGSAAPLSSRTEALLAELTEAGGGTRAGTAVARVIRFGAMVYVPRTSGSRLVQVTAVESGYPFYGRVETSPAQGWERLGSQGGALVDPSLLDALEARVGDILALGLSRFEIRGTVDNIPGDVAVRAALGPRVFIAARDAGSTGLLGFGSRGRYEAFVRLPKDAAVQRLAERFRKPFAEERVTLRTVSEDQDNVNDTLGRMARFLGLVALVALLLGGLGVASAVHVFIQRRTETIAVLRCLGARTWQVFAAYLLQSAFMGLAGSAVGAAVGIGVQAVLPRVLGDFVPVDVDVHPSARAMGTGIVIGLLVSVLFSLLPLLRIREVSPLLVFRKDYEPPPRSRRDLLLWLTRLALAATVAALAVLEAENLRTGLVFALSIGVALLALWLAAAGLVRAVKRFFPSRLPYLWRQGLANLYRPANQTVTVVLALGFGAFLLDTLFLVQHNLLRAFRLDGAEGRPNLVFFDIQSDQREALTAALRGQGCAPRPLVPIVPMRIDSVRGARAAAIVGSAPPAPNGPEASRRWALRREYRSTYRDDLVSSERVVAGRAWESDGWRTAAPGSPVPVSLEEGIARELHVGVGDEIVWDVQGVPLKSRVESLRRVDWRRFEPNFFAVFPRGPLDSAPQSYVTLVRIDDPTARSRVQRKVLESFPNVTAIDLSQVQRSIEQVLQQVAIAVRFMAAFSLATGVFVLVGAVAASRYQRLREAVLLKTLGATRAQVARVLVAEYVCLGTLAAAGALLLSTVAGWALQHYRFETSFAVPIVSMGALALAVITLTVAVGLWSSWDAARRPPLEVLRAE